VVGDYQKHKLVLRLDRVISLLLQIKRFATESPTTDGGWGFSTATLSREKARGPTD
jgi:hypothetical protein